MGVILGYRYEGFVENIDFWVFVRDKEMRVLMIVVILVLEVCIGEEFRDFR